MMLRGIVPSGVYPLCDNIGDHKFLEKAPGNTLKSQYNLIIVKIMTPKKLRCQTTIISYGALQYLRKIGYE